MLPSPWVFSRNSLTSPLETVAKLGQLMAYKHDGFWQCMDTVREKETLEKMWLQGQAPWKVWAD